MTLTHFLQLTGAVTLGNQIASWIIIGAQYAYNKRAESRARRQLVAMLGGAPDCDCANCKARRSAALAN